MLFWIVIIVLVVAPVLHFNYIWREGDKWYHKVDFAGVRIICWFLAVLLILGKAIF